MSFDDYTLGELYNLSDQLREKMKAQHAQIREAARTRYRAVIDEITRRNLERKRKERA